VTGTIDPSSQSNIAFTADNPSDGLLAGENIIKYIEYETDGNYKMEVKLHATEAIIFGSLRAGKCAYSTHRGIDVLDETMNDVMIRIDLAKCQLVCDENTALLRSIDAMNQPIEIEFTLAKVRNDPETLFAHYKIAAAALYHEDYILDFNTHSKHVEQTIVLPSGDIVSQQHNLQFTFMTFTNDDFTQKTYNSQTISPPDWPTYLEICPTNGFTPDKMVSIPELCFLRDVTNNNMVLLWDMQKSDQCVSGLVYMPEQGLWQYALNFNQAMGYEAGSITHNNFQLTCNIRVCSNIFGNACEQILEACQYVDC